MKVVNYSINTFYVLKMAICLRSLNLFLKKWEFKHLGSFPGLVPFQGDYGYRVYTRTVYSTVPGTRYSTRVRAARPKVIVKVKV